MDWILESLNFWNIMGLLGLMLTGVMLAAAAYGLVQGLADGWRDSFPDGFRWPWQAAPGGGEKPRIFRSGGAEERGPGGY